MQTTFLYPVQIVNTYNREKTFKRLENDNIFYKITNFKIKNKQMFFTYFIILKLSLEPRMDQVKILGGIVTYSPQK